MKRHPALLLLLVLATLLAGRALGAESSSVVVACSEPFGGGANAGLMHTPAADGSCPAGWTEVAWNEAGPPGEIGEQGPRGTDGGVVRGPQGRPGANARGYAVLGYHPGGVRGDAPDVVGRCPAGAVAIGAGWDYSDYDYRTVEVTSPHLLDIVTGRSARTTIGWARGIWRSSLQPPTTSDPTWSYSFDSARATWASGDSVEGVVEKADAKYRQPVTLHAGPLCWSQSP